MPYCAVLECKNDSQKCNLNKGGVSYHRFPKDPYIKEKWIDATGRINWMPTKLSTICSKHFSENDLLISKKGYRYTKPSALPTLNIVKVFNQPQNFDDAATCTSKMQGDPESSDFTTSPKKTQLHQDKHKVEQIFLHEGYDSVSGPHSVANIKTENVEDIDATDSSEYLTQREKKLKGQLRFCESKIRKQILKIKRLQSKNRRLKNQKINIEEILTRLEEKFGIPTENVDYLRNINLEVDELAAREVTKTESGIVSSRMYSPALRSFALTLHYYSPKAYNYVRKTFKTNLPLTRILKNWYTKVGGEPGFTKESFAALKQKAAKLSNQPLLATLVLGEMSIDRRVESNGGKSYGYVDMGTELDGDYMAEANGALVFLVTAINSNFKVPVGFFLVDNACAEKRANLVKLCLELIHNTGVRIVALTFNICLSNICMAKLLGCSFEDQNVTFKHPVTKNPVIAVLDPCHMVESLRKTLQMYEILVDQNGNKIQWQHLVEVKKRYAETLHLSNKLRDRYMKFQNERLKIKSGIDLLSIRVAEAVKHCRQSGINAYHDSEPTEKFLIICNNLLEIFNSTNLHLSGYKKALNETNVNVIFEFLGEAFDYIRNLKLENGTLLIESPRKTGFLGLLGCMKALEHLYSSLIETKDLLFLPFYKLSLEHLELFFCNIKAHSGSKSNNDPTARQFISAYKKILFHAKLKDTNKDNCVALEQISILKCESPVERINKRASIVQDMTHDIAQAQRDQNEEKTEIEELGEFFTDFSDFSNQTIIDIAGYIVRILIKKISCDICVDALVTHHFQPFHKFIIAKDKGGWLSPSPDVVEICRTAETSLRYADIRVFRKEVAMAQIMRKFIGTRLFNDIAFHQLGEFPASNHVTDLMKAIVERYINIRLHNFFKLQAQLFKRQLFKKYLLGQL